mmetsp:Transcript_13360/g.19641  ORF Transcript_13360/g.19641 Transcript_13360/m.19641 type:complete len:212 (-) Transcript_13360:133-768(-)|eukprot:CAMPEP_0194064020 /NCGR_PEP_ID=MMETSP0009_2-20130614/81937_1 /TAXON_ID=210454 /ORGANISM="Grammatophora oceanica, Strain CCMP 410" /LENGTH=211 /DNA_ID=CAMNT_0038716365 /DNA_START=67 /DNA_END=702 /DNA_ORIENTATION=-
MNRTTETKTTEFQVTRRLISLGKGNLVMKEQQVHRAAASPMTDADLEMQEAHVLDDGCTIDTEQGTLSMSSMEDHPMNEFEDNRRRKHHAGVGGEGRDASAVYSRSSERENDANAFDYEPVPSEIIIQSCEDSQELLGEAELMMTLLDQLYANGDIDPQDQPDTPDSPTSKPRKTFDDVSFGRETFNWTAIDGDYSLDSLKYYNRQKTSFR